VAFYSNKTENTQNKGFPGPKKSPFSVQNPFFTPFLEEKRLFFSLE